MTDNPYRSPEKNWSGATAGPGIPQRERRSGYRFFWLIAIILSLPFLLWLATFGLIGLVALWRDSGMQLR